MIDDAAKNRVPGKQSTPVAEDGDEPIVKFFLSEFQIGKFHFGVLQLRFTKVLRVAEGKEEHIAAGRFIASDGPYARAAAPDAESPEVVGIQSRCSLPTADEQTEGTPHAAQRAQSTARPLPCDDIFCRR